MLSHSSESIQDATGAWTQQSGTWQHVGICREETNGRGSTVSTADGKVIVFASLVQLPVGTTRINEGTIVLITRNKHTDGQITDGNIADWKKTGEVVAQGKCMKFDNGRLHCRMWI
jgi:hypothetical protein